MEDCGDTPMLPTYYWKFAYTFMIFAWLVKLICRELIMYQMLLIGLLHAVIDFDPCRQNMDDQMPWNPLKFALKPQALEN